jgi:hypothetical protein
MRSSIGSVKAERRRAVIVSADEANGVEADPILGIQCPLCRLSWFGRGGSGRSPEGGPELPHLAEEELDAHFAVAHHDEGSLEYLGEETVSFTIPLLDSACSHLTQVQAGGFEDEAEATGMTLSRLLLHNEPFREPPTLALQEGTIGISDLRLEDEDGVDAFYQPLPEPDELEKRGAPRPILRGRINPLTSWSTRIVPGCLADLNPELDKLWDGGEFRHYLRHQEEAYVWQWHHVSDLHDIVVASFRANLRIVTTAGV